MEERSHMTKRILDLTLEIIYLLNGENYIAFKLSDGLLGYNVMKKQRPVIDPHAIRKNYKKVQELTIKVIELLMGKVPIRCQDDGSGFSIEGHKELYKDTIMARKSALTSPDQSSNRNTPERCPSPRYSWNSTQEHRKISQDEEVLLDVNQTDGSSEAKEGTDDPYMMGDESYKEEDFPPEITTDPKDTEFALRTIKVEVEEEEDDEVRQIKVEDEEYPLEIGMDGQHNTNNPEERSNVSPERANYIRDPSGDPCTLRAGLPGHPYPITQHTDHRGGDMFPCFVCGRFFTQRAILISHQRNHTLEGPFLCSVCGKCFSRKAYFIDHERTHTGERPYSCSVCGKCFNQKSALATHQRIHTAEKPYPCSECGRCFTQKAHLIIHQRTHTGEKPYSCSECGKCFNQRSSLATHQRIHTGEKRYPCSECGKCFSQLGTLITHQRIHTGEKPYSCSDCSKCFTRRTYLTDHQKTHTGEKPFSCSECGRCFSRKAKLIEHQRTHMGVKP